MKKLFILIIILTFGLILGGCSKKIKQNIIFDDNYIILETKNQFQQTKNEKIEGDTIIKQYIQYTETGFVGSIVIAKNQIEYGTDIYQFGDNNTKSLTRKIESTKKPSTKKFSFKCDGEKISGIQQRFIIKEGNEKYYLNQTFFIKSGYIYGISTMSEDKKENKNLRNSTKDINCLGSQK